MVLIVLMMENVVDCCCCSVCFFFQAEDGIRDLVRSRGLGDVYKRQVHISLKFVASAKFHWCFCKTSPASWWGANMKTKACLLYTSDAADERSSVDLGGRRIIKKKKTKDIKESQIVVIKHVQN